jgi:hypothetical protein
MMHVPICVSELCNPLNRVAHAGELASHQISIPPPIPYHNTMFRDFVNIPLHFVGQASHENYL